MLNTNHLMGNERGYSNEYLLETAQDELHAKTALRMARAKTDASIQQLKAIPVLSERVADAEEGLSIARR